MPIYHVTNGDKQHLVLSKTRGAAVRHVSKDWQARPISAEELVELQKSGLIIEDADAVLAPRTTDDDGQTDIETAAQAAA